MDQKELRQWEARCIQEEPPRCRAGCPLNVDGRAFVSAMAKGDFEGARKILEKSMPLAGIVGRLCEAPCEQFCLRTELGGSVSIGLLERYCVNYSNARSKMLCLPLRPKRVAVIGSGPSGLTVAFDLGKKGYPVDLYHLNESPGAWLRDVSVNILPEEVLDNELQRLQKLKVSFVSVEKLDRSIFDEKTYDAYYVGLDDRVSAPLRDLAQSPDMRTFCLSESGWFSGGLCSLNDRYRFITDVSQGREAAVSMDRFLQGVSLTASRPTLRNGKTDLYTNIETAVPSTRVVPAENNQFSRREAIEEAGRCLDCQCLECVKNCVYLADHDGYPKTYARRIYNNSAIVKGIHQVNRFINSCSLCDQCKTICPNDFSMSELCLEARRLMVREGRMPPSAYWFGLEEMRSARSQGALVCHAPKETNSKTLFFPGCQLAGIRPDQTLRLYDWLLEHEPQTGIWLDCCAAPAYWAGQEDEHQEICRELTKIWRKIGEVPVLTACSSCLKMFRQYLPEIQVDSVWKVLSELPFSAVNNLPVRALSDPCSARHDETTRNHVRIILEMIGQPLSVLEMSGALTECCGFGGLMESANPVIARKTVEKRAAQTEDSILTYCAMCRDQLARVGKDSLHILDVIFPETTHASEEPPVSLSMRRINRRTLKKELAARYPETEQPAPEPWEAIELNIPDAIRTLMEERRILADDIRRVLYKTNESGSYLVHADEQTMVASARLGEVTFWIRYRMVGAVHYLERCWSHRMQINGGPA